MPFNNVPLYGDGKIVPCTVCKFPVRLTYRQGHLDRYVPYRDQVNWDVSKYLNKNDPRTERLLRKAREGKKTACLVGWAPSSCALAPYNDPNVKLGGNLEIWGLNQAHLMPWMTTWTRWFQLHGEHSYKKEYSVKHKDHGGVKGHYDWLKTNHNKPIYMLFQQPEIPNSIEYPLQDVIKEFFGNASKGFRPIKYFTSSLPYMIAMALMEGKINKEPPFQRIEIYGFEMAAEDEYLPQKACAEFWIGIALGRGVEVYLPQDNSLLRGPLYGYQGIGSRNEIPGS